MADAIVSYIPGLHKGYIDLFKKYPGSLYILGADFIKQAPRMERDIRALAPEEIKSLLEGLHILSKIIVLNETNIQELVDDSSAIIMPDEDVNRKFAETYLEKKEVKFVKTFLRWDRQISTTEFEVAPDRVISEAAFDQEIIAETFKEAEKSPDWWRQIGAVLVRDKKSILASHNTPIPAEQTPNMFGDPRANFDAGEAQYKELGKFVHAEAGIIAEAAKRGLSTDGASLYVSTFPCPACAKLVAAAGIKEVYYSKGYSLLDAEDVLRNFCIKIIMVK